MNKSKSMRNVNVGQIFLLFGLTVCALALADEKPHAGPGGNGANATRGQAFFPEYAGFASRLEKLPSLKVSRVGADKSTDGTIEPAQLKEMSASLLEAMTYREKLNKECAADPSAQSLGELLDSCFTDTTTYLKVARPGDKAEIQSVLFISCQDELKAYFEKKVANEDDKKLLASFEKFSKPFIGDVATPFVPGNTDKLAQIGKMNDEFLVQMNDVFDLGAKAREQLATDKACKFAAAPASSDDDREARDGDGDEDDDSTDGDEEDAAAKKKKEEEAAAAAKKAEEARKTAAAAAANPVSPNLSAPFPSVGEQQPGFNQTAEEDVTGGLAELLPLLAAAQNQQQFQPPVIPPSAPAPAAESAQPAPAAPVIPPTPPTEPPREESQQPVPQEEPQQAQQQMPFQPMPTPTPAPTPNYDQIYERERQAREDAKEERALEEKKIAAEEKALTAKAEEKAKAEANQQMLLAQQQQMMMMNGGQWGQPVNGYAQPGYGAIAGGAFGTNAQRLQQRSGLRPSSRPSGGSTSEQQYVSTGESTGGSTRGQLGPISARPSGRAVKAK